MTEPGGHRHARGHEHGHHQGHGHAHGANERAVGIAALLTGGFMLAEVAGGLLAGSLALLADAGHMLTDFAALAMSWLAFRMARRPADATRTYGFDRLSVLAAFVNGIALFAIAAWIVIEAVRRLAEPHAVTGGIMLVVAVAGLLVNIAGFWVLSRGDRGNLNLRGALLHVMGDLLGSVATIVAALVILWTGWMPADPLLSVLVALVILRSAWHVVRDSGHILLEGTPPGFDAGAIASDLCGAIPAVTDVRHVHGWSITEARPMVTLEAVVPADADADATRRLIKARMAERFGFDHTTVEVHSEPEPEAIRA